MQFIAEYQIDPDLCDSLMALHKLAETKGLIVRGKVGKGMGHIVDKTIKDSYDLGVINVPDDLQVEYKIPDYFLALKECVTQYFAHHEILRLTDPIELLETPIIQHYKPGGGFKKAHFERTGINSTTRMLTWMTYLNDVTDGGGTHFSYQNHTVTARKGKTLIWPSDFTHTHYGVVSPTQDKYIITGWLNFSQQG